MRSNGQFREGKRSIYEGGHRTPFIIRWSAGITKPGRSFHGPVCQTDLLATFAEMLGTKLPAGAGEDSQSFFGVLKKDTTLRRVPMIHHSSSGGFAIRDGKWKLVMGRRKRELYDLSSDPSETNNVIEEHLDVAKRLERALTRIVVNGRSTPGDPVSNDTGYWNDLYWMDENDYVR